MDNPVVLTRAELRVWALEKLGIKATEGGGRLWVTEPSSLLNTSPPDPCRDIAEAWRLKEWLWVLPNNGDLLSPQQKFVGEWKVGRPYAMPSNELATWICCTVYWAVEGVRVEVKEDAGRTALNGAEGED